MESTFQTKLLKISGSKEDLKFEEILNSHFSVRTADQQLLHYVRAAFQTLQWSRPNPKHQSPGVERMPGHPLDVGVVYIVVEHPPADTV